jgi:MFS family permease
VAQPGPGPAGVRGRLRFYGWTVVAGLAVAGGASMLTGVGNMGIFVEPMNAELDMGRAPFGWALTARLAGFAVAGPLIGRAIDRYGARAPLAVAGVLAGGAAAAQGLIDAAWQLVALTFIGGLLGFWGSSTLYLTVPVAKWFVRRRGKAMAMVFIGVPLGIAIANPLTQAIVGAVGWRMAWVILGGGAAVLMLAMSAFVIRSRPEDMGLAPDGMLTAPAGGPPGAHGGDEHPWTVREAVRTPTFWKMSVAFGTLMFGLSSMGVFMVPFFISKGEHPQIVAFAFATQALSQVGTSLTLSPYLDRLPIRFVAPVGFCLMVAGFALGVASWNTSTMFLATVVTGMGTGSGMLLQAHMWPHYFGRRHIGAIRGLATPVSLGFSAFGGAVAGTIIDATSSFTPAWAITGGLVAGGAVLLLLTSRPYPRREP